MDNEIERLSKELDQLRGRDGEIDSARQSALKALGEFRQHRDRSFIVRSVLWLYICAIAALFLLFICRALFWSDSAAFANLLDLLKVAVLPLATLVVGYYFGSARSG
jgi:hypothetical protein